MFRALSKMMMRPKPIKQPITVDDLHGFTSNTWENAWINKLWIQRLGFSNPTVYGASSGTVNHTTYRTWENLTHILAWVPGVYEITIMQNGGGGGGADDFYLQDGEGGAGATGETTDIRTWRLHTAGAGLYRVRLPNRGANGGGRDSSVPTDATPGGSGGQRLTSDIAPAAHAGGRAATSSSGYSKTPTGNGGAGGDFGAYGTNFGQSGGWGYTKIQLIG